jgi:hypothetical protein
VKDVMHKGYWPIYGEMTILNDFEQDDECSATDSASFVGKI